MGRDYMYLAGAGGYLLSVRQSDGRLICLKTGSKDADSWYEWGGNAQHNKVQ